MDNTRADYYVSTMRQKILISVMLAFFTCYNPSISIAAPKSGASCPRIGMKEEFGNKRFTCIKSGKKLIWNKGVTLPKPVTDSSRAKSLPTPNVVLPTPNADRASAAEYPLTSRNAFADIEICKVKSTLTGSESVGFPRNTAIPSVGALRGVTLFVEYSDLKDDGNPIRVWKNQQKPTAENYYKIASYGKLNLKVDLVEKVYPIKKSVLTYNLDTHHDAPAKPNANPGELVLDAMNAADSDVDFSKYDFVNVVTPSTTMIGFEGAIGLENTFDGKQFRRATFGSIREYEDSLSKYNWLVHESGHLLGLLHPYSYNNSGFVIPTWDLMGDAATENSEFLAWHKFLLGWLDSSQIDCLDSNNKSITTHLISPLTEKNTDVKTIIVKLSENEALVLENRRKSALNNIDGSQEGVLAYLVNGTIKPGTGAVSFLFSKLTTNRDGRLIGTLKTGESVTHKNIKVNVLSSAVSGDYVSVTIS